MRICDDMSVDFLFGVIYGPSFFHNFFDETNVDSIKFLKYEDLFL